MKIKLEFFYSEELCRDNPTWLFVFGDNKQGVGKGGQAIIRDEPNAFGISTKYDVMHSYSDDRFVENKRNIETDIEELKLWAETFDTVVFPIGGLGTGLAALQMRAPKTFLYLSQRLLEEFNYNNVGYLVSPSYNVLKNKL